MFWIFVAVASIAILYWLSIRPYNFWIKQGVEQGNPKPFFGHHWGMIAGTQSFAEMVQSIYNMSSKARYVGAYQFFTPVLVVKDPDLIKQVGVKDFDHFLDHPTLISEEADPLWTNNLFALTGKKWRDMRATLSPSFTSSKMKYMFNLISKNGQQFVEYFLKKNQEVVTVEMKDILTRFTNDVIANSAFGLECDSLTERTNEFYLMGKETTNFSGFWRRIVFFSFSFAPKLSKILKLRLFSKEVANFFSNIVTTNIKSREVNGFVRPDMIQLLLQGRKNGLSYDETQEKDTGFATVQESEIGKSMKKQKLTITDQDMASQAMIFFFAGFDTVSSLMCFMSYELAINPDVQKRLIEDIDETWDTCNGNLTYEALMGIKYLDMVISESLRKWPIAILSDRQCTKPYTIEPKYPGEKPIHLKKGDLLWIPTFGIHRDPEYYSEPDRFDPERFSEENKDKINPYTYMPFGVGPRNCIGSRFALMEVKILFFYVLKYFEIVPVEKTPIPLVIDCKELTFTAKGGFWLGLKRRSKST